MSSQHMGASAAPRREFPTNFTCHLVQAVLGVIWADQAALLVAVQQADQAALPSPSMSRDVMCLQSAEQ